MILVSEASPLIGKFPLAVSYTAGYAPRVCGALGSSSIKEQGSFRPPSISCGHPSRRQIRTSSGYQWPMVFILRTVVQVNGGCLPFFASAFNQPFARRWRAAGAAVRHLRSDRRQQAVNRDRCDSGLGDSHGNRALPSLGFSLDRRTRRDYLDSGSCTDGAACRRLSVHVAQSDSSPPTTGSESHSRSPAWPAKATFVAGLICGAHK